MIFNETTIRLKDGRTAILRSPREEDAKDMLRFIIKACGETDFLLKYPEDFYKKVKQYRLGFEDFDDFIRESSTLMVTLSAIDKVIRDEDSTVIELADAIESIKISKTDNNKI